MLIVKTGMERFIKSPPKWVYNKHLGLLCNPASVDSKFNHSRELIHKLFPGKLKALYSPQHGFFAEKQDNMIESENIIDPVLNIPVFSLYGGTRMPDKEMFDPIDILIVDLQDVGTRVYTFATTMSYCLEAAKKFNKKVLILDRPNPVGGTMVEGNCLSLEFTSFVGRYPIPMRHGLTLGELALLFNNEYGIGCNLEVVRMKNWKRSMFFNNTGLPWIPPSPNLPTPMSAMVYPGQVLWEGTNVSEGRGTTQPFEIFGAPFINREKILSSIDYNTMPGMFLRPVAFEPVSNKWKNRLCYGFQIHVTDKYEFKPYLTSLKLLQTIIFHHKKHFKYKQPPYEYEFKRMPIDLITGDIQIRKKIESLDKIENVEQSWQKNLKSFKELSKKYYLYN